MSLGGAAGSALQLQAATPAAGFALTAGTPTLLTWTPPNDGKQHRFIITASMHVTVATTGGEVDADFTLPDGTATSEQIYTATQGTGAPWPNDVSRVVKAGAAVTVVQSSPVTAGAALVWAEIWGS